MTNHRTVHLAQEESLPLPQNRAYCGWTWHWTPPWNMRIALTGINHQGYSRSHHSPRGIFQERIQLSYIEAINCADCLHAQKLHRRRNAKQPRPTWEQL